MPPSDRFLSGFARHRVKTGAGDIHLAEAGRGGRPVLLLHGHPQTHLTWHRVAPALVAAGFHVIAPDLRGYGDSARPPGGERHAGYSKRAMAADQIEIMAAFGHRRFAVVGHDRGGRVAHRLALDHPDGIERLAVLDIAPTLTMYRRTDRAFATRYFWWFFLIQPEPLPERLIGADPAFFLETHLRGQSMTPGCPDPDLVAEYLRCYRLPGTIHAICEDYRAAATIDLDHDLADETTGRLVIAPLLALWGEKGTVGSLYDVLATWQEKATEVSGKALPCGHTLQEECPVETVAALLDFLG